MINNKTTNLQGEAAIIGTLLREPDGYSYVRDLLEPKHFSEPVAASTYEVISRLSSRDKGHSLIDIKPYIDADAVITQGQTMFEMLTNWTVHLSMPVFSLVDMAKSIIDLYKIRSLYSAAESLANQISNLTPEDDANALGEAAMAEIGSIISDGGEVYGAVSFGQAIKGALDATNEAHKGKLTNSVAFNFGPVDELISKLTAGQFMVVGGGTKQGKTALAGQLLMGAARSGTPVWVYSGEMTAQELAMRESARESMVTVKRQKSGKVSESEYAKMMKFSEASQDLPVFIQQKRLNLDQIEERIKQFRHKKGFCLIVIDHLGLIERRKHEMRMESWAFGEVVTGTLKRIAQEQEIAVIGCAQLKKNTFHDQREMISSKTFTQILSRRPKYSDLIGNIERDADHVILPFRPVVFLQEKEPVYGSDLHLEWEELVKQHDNKAQIVLALSRENKWPRSIDCGWQGNITSFIDLGGMKDKDQQSSNAYQGNPFALV